MKKETKYKGYSVDEDGNIYGQKGFVLKQARQATGYRTVTIVSKEPPNTVSCHRIVAETLIPNPHNKSTVNHIDGNKANNHPSNLEWATYSENALHGYRIGKNSSRGEKNSQAKLTECDVLYVRESLDTNSALAEMYGVIEKSIRNIRNRTTWKHI